MPGPDRDDVLARISLADILTREVGPPKRVGSHWWWPSVDPSLEGTGKSPPTHIYTTTADGVELFKDFTSGLSGTAVDVLMARRGVDFATALAALARHAGIDDTGHQHLPPPLPRTTAPRRPPRPPTPELVAWLAECAERLWWSDTQAAAAARTWLDGRGYERGLLIEARVGYDVGAYHDQQRPKDLREEHGIPKLPGVTFPVFDRLGHVVYAQTRNLRWAPGSEYPKYVNPTGILNPGIGIWADPPSQGAQAGAPVIVVEGPTDALAARQAGYDTAGLIGAGRASNPATVQHLVEVFGTNRPYVVMTDPDPAGRTAGQALVVHLWHTGATAVYRAPADGDVADWVRTSSAAFRHQFADHIADALAAITVVARQAIAGDPAFIERAANGELEPQLRNFWDEHHPAPSPVASSTSPSAQPPARHRDRPAIRHQHGRGAGVVTGP